MKIAVITDDFATISAHFGRAQYYLVFEVNDGKIVAQEKRAKAYHGQFGEQESHAHNAGEGHGTDPAAQARHATMMDPIADCAVMIGRGMGTGAYNSLTARGIRPILTEIPDILAAVEAYLSGKIVDHTERLH